VGSLPNPTHPQQNEGWRNGFFKDPWEKQMTQQNYIYGSKENAKKQNME